MVITRYPALDRSDVHRASLEAFAGAGFAEVEDHNSPDAVGFGPMPMTTSAGRRQTTLDAYLPPDVDLPTLRIVTDAGVDRIAIEAGRAKGVRLIDGSQVEADEVICAAGVYGSPCLLMRSGVGPADQLRALGIRIVADLPGVGANLADHPGADLDSGWRGAHVPARPTLHSIATRRSTSQPTEAPPDLMFWVTDPEGEDPRFAFDPILLKPESRGSVRLRSADPLDKPRITLPKPTARDVDRLMEGYALGIELANDPAIRRLASGPAPRGGSQARLRRLVVDGTYSIPHVVGTCRMGPSPADGDVVDATGCVHGIEALRVADTSVIPDAVAGFPQLVAIMLAERIATFV
jgi:choline dehydrogenase